MEEALLRGWHDLIARLDGPMHLRFILQPAVAAFLAIRAGVQDARDGKAPFLLALCRKEQRRERLRHACVDIGRVFALAVALDAVYQVGAHRSIYLLELLVTATLLAIVPYGLFRSLATPIARVHLRRRDARHASSV
jgi:hypothetical protein